VSSRPEKPATRLRPPGTAGGDGVHPQGTHTDRMRSARRQTWRSRRRSQGRSCRAEPRITVSRAQHLVHDRDARARACPRRSIPTSRASRLQNRPPAPAKLAVAATRPQWAPGRLAAIQLLDGATHPAKAAKQAVGRALDRPGAGRTAEKTQRGGDPAKQVENVGRSGGRPGTMFSIMNKPNEVGPAIAAHLMLGCWFSMLTELDRSGSAVLPPPPTHVNGELFEDCSAVHRLLERCVRTEPHRNEHGCELGRAARCTVLVDPASRS